MPSSGSTSTRACKRRVGVMAATAVCGLLGACAPSARDQFIASQQMTVRAEAASESAAPMTLVKASGDGPQTAHVMAEP